MKIGVKRFTYAKYASGGNGSAVQYTGGVMTKDKTVHVEYTTERDEGAFHADDHIIDRANAITGVNVVVELATLTKDIAAALLGWEQVGSTSEYHETGEEAPYVGVGWAVPIRGDVGKYRGVWVYKLQMGLENDNANTRGQNIEWQTDTISGGGMAVQLTDGGHDVFRAVMFESADLAACEAWLKGKAGITP